MKFAIMYENNDDSLVLHFDNMASSFNPTDADVKRIATDIRNGSFIANRLPNPHTVVVTETDAQRSITYP